MGHIGKLLAGLDLITDLMIGLNLHLCLAGVVQFGIAIAGRRCQDYRLGRHGS